MCLSYVIISVIIIITFIIIIMFIIILYLEKKHYI